MLLKGKSKATAVALSMLIVACPVFSAGAAEVTNNSAVSQNNITVSKSSIDYSDASYEIQSALDDARYNATESNPYTVTVEAGEYTLNSALRLYSNTTLVLTGVTLYKNADRSINALHIGDYDDYTSGVTGYNAYSNIKIVDGTIDGSNSTNTLAKAAHCSNVTFSGTTFQNNYNAHLMEVAAIDGLYMYGCTFKNQLLDAGLGNYEAMQIDVLAPSNFNGYRVEDLPCKNITVDGCTFDNCPRGVGSHTSITNAPHTNINITNNSFTNMGSAAIQGQYWVNCKITNNTLDNTPRGIAVYNKFSFKPSTLAAYGNTTQHYSDTYVPIENQNIVISNNNISHCGYVKDIYATYECSAISAVGEDCSSQNLGDASGDYYVNGITVCDNIVEVKGHGIRFGDARNATAEYNNISCSANTVNPSSYHGIALYGTQSNGVNGNRINGAQNHNIYIRNGSYVTNVSNNAISNSGEYGIDVDAGRADSISNNIIYKAGDNGIHITNASNVKEITKNSIDITGWHGIALYGGSSCSNISNNVIIRYDKKMIQVSDDSSASQGNNYASDTTNGVSVSKNELALTVGESSILTSKASPSNLPDVCVWTSTDSSVAFVVGGKITAKKAGTATIMAKTENNIYAYCTVTVKAPEPQALPGDADCDGIVTISDVTAVQRHLSGMDMLTAQGELAADVNKDGILTIDDATTIQRYVAGVIESLTD